MATVNHTGLAVVVEVPRADLLPVAQDAPPPQQSVAVPLASAVPGRAPASRTPAPAQARTAFHLIIETSDSVVVNMLRAATY